MIGQDVPYLAVWNFEADCGEISEPVVILWELLEDSQSLKLSAFASANLKIGLVFTGLA